LTKTRANCRVRRRHERTKRAPETCRDTATASRRPDSTCAKIFLIDSMRLKRVGRVARCSWEGVFDRCRDREGLPERALAGCDRNGKRAVRLTMSLFFSRIVKHRWRVDKMETGRTRSSCLRRMSVIAQR
jgi:hypothetical protein